MAYFIAQYPVYKNQLSTHASVPSKYPLREAKARATDSLHICPEYWKFIFRFQRAHVTRAQTALRVRVWYTQIRVYDRLCVRCVWVNTQRPERMHIACNSIQFHINPQTAPTYGPAINRGLSSCRKTYIHKLWNANVWYGIVWHVCTLYICTYKNNMYTCWPTRPRFSATATATATTKMWQFINLCSRTLEYICMYMG